MRLLTFLVALFLLPSTFCHEADTMMREHCAPLLNNGLCNLECKEEFMSLDDFETAEREQMQGDCVLFPIETKQINLTLTFNSSQSRNDINMEAALVSIWLQAKLRTISYMETDPKWIKFFLDVDNSINDDVLVADIEQLKREIRNQLGVTVAEALVDGFAPRKKEDNPDSILSKILIGLAVFLTFFGIGGVVGTKRTRTSRELKDIPVWIPPKESQLGVSKFGHHFAPAYETAMMGQYNQQMQNYEQYLQYPPAAHYNQGYLTSPNFIQPQVHNAVIQEPSVLYTQACCGNISTPINTAELAVYVAGIFPIHAVLLRHSNRSITREEETRMIEDLRKILEAGGEINEKTCIERNWNPQKGIKDEETALMIAVVRGLYAVAEFLLEKGADQWEINKTNSICMHQAVQNMDVKMMKLLLEYHRKDPERDELIDGRPKLEGLDVSSKTPLMYTAEATPLYAVEMAKLLIENGAAVDSTDDKKNRSVIHYAAIHDNLKLLDYLVDLADAKILDLQDIDGCTALMLAVEYDYTAVVEKLLNAGASFVVPNVRNETPRNVAISRNNMGIVEMLDECKKQRSKRKSSPHTTPQEKRTPRTDNGSVLGDVTNTVFQTPPSSNDNDVNMTYTPVFATHLTPPESAKTTGYDFARHWNPLYV